MGTVRLISAKDNLTTKQASKQTTQKNKTKQNKTNQ